jgi:hypothetical protein
MLRGHLQAYAASVHWIRADPSVAAESDEVFVHGEDDVGPNVRRLSMNNVDQFLGDSPASQSFPCYEDKSKDLVEMILGGIDRLAGGIVDGHALRGTV